MSSVTEPFAALIVTAGGRLCALGLEHVLEVMRPQPVRSMRSSFGFVEGVAIIRGEPTPVLNLALLLGDTRPAPPGRLVTLRVGARPVAMAVGSIRAVRELDPAWVVDLPPLLRDSDSEHIERLARLDTELVTVLGAARLVPEALWMELERAGGAP